MDKDMPRQIIIIALVVLQLTLSIGRAATNDYERIVQDVLASRVPPEKALIQIRILYLPSFERERLVEINVGADGSASLRCAAVRGKPIQTQTNRLTLLHPDDRRRSVEIESTLSSWTPAQTRDEVGRLNQAYREGVSDLFASASQLLDSDTFSVVLDGTQYKLSIEVAGQRFLQLGIVEHETREVSSPNSESVGWSKRIIAAACRAK